MAKHTDITFDKASCYGSIRWVCVTMGRSQNWFHRKRLELEQIEGFPKPDGVTGHYIKADIFAWIAKRRQIADSLKVQSTTEPSARINNDAL